MPTPSEINQPLPFHRQVSFDIKDSLPLYSAAAKVILLIDGGIICPDTALIMWIRPIKKLLY
jgi:hypothetical protein